MKMNNLKDYVTFYKFTTNGPEPGAGTKTEVMKAYAEIYEPSAKDIQLGNLETDKLSLTIIIRNTYPEYVPKVSHTFTVDSGMYQGESFNIKHVAPKDTNFMKIVGVSDGR